MLSIGEFARHGGVSLRMLRHYDAIGLLPPARVDAGTGQRWYAAGQLDQLNRIVVLRDMGFGLARIRDLVREQVSPQDLRSVLRTRRAQLEQEVAAEGARLARIEARLRALDAVGGPVVGVLAKQLPAVPVVELTGVAATFTPADITPVIRPLGARLEMVLSEHGLPAAGHPIAYYDLPPDGSERVGVHASLPVDRGASEVPAGLSYAVLPAAEVAATVVHQGRMDDVLSSLAVLTRWIEENGQRACGAPREVYLETGPDESRWVTELQQPIQPAEVG